MLSPPVLPTVGTEYSASKGEGLVPASCILLLMSGVYPVRTNSRIEIGCPSSIFLQIARRSRATTKPPTNAKGDRKKAKEEASRKQQERSAKQRSLSLAMLACGREEHHLSQYLLFVPTCPGNPSFTCLRKNSNENKNKNPTITAITKARHQPQHSLQTSHRFRSSTRSVPCPVAPTAGASRPIQTTIHPRDWGV